MFFCLFQGFNLLELARNMKLTKKASPPPAPTTALPALSAGNVVVDLAAWLAGRVPHQYWRRLGRSAAAPLPADALPPRDTHLAHKYLARWRERVRTDPLVRFVLKVLLALSKSFRIGTVQSE